MKIAIIFLFTLNLLIGQAIANSDYQLDLRPDHAKLSSGHIDSAEKYMDLMLKVDGKYEFLKVQQFLQRLKSEKQSLLEDSYETALIENLELKWADFDEAKKDATKELDEKKNDLAQGYNKFLIPQIELLSKKIKDNAPEVECDAIVDAFNIVYSAYYTPEAKRNMWAMDMKIYTNLGEAIIGYKYQKEDANNELQPNNLTITTHQLGSILECLEKNNQDQAIKANEPLTHEQVLKIYNCDFDISKLNPVKSPFWREVYDDPSIIKDAKDLLPELFPKENEKMYYSEMKYSSAGSKKLNGYITRNGKKIKFKVKMGQEAFVEIASTYLAQLVGFHQDHVSYKGNMKLYFNNKETSFEKFKRAWRRRHGSFENLVGEKGVENGEEYVILRNVLLESKVNEKIRLETFHPDGWDLPNRREHRGVLAFYSWLNVGDMKVGNFMVNLVKTKEGDLIPELSLQDLGYSLRSNLALRPKYIYKNIKYTTASRTVNAFEVDFLSYDQNFVKLFWNDISFQSNRFSTTTYNDLRWMVRKIARLSMDDIRYSLLASGMPKDSQDLYALKIGIRRNSLIKAFDLEKEFPLFELPDLDSYSPNSNIKNGKIVLSQLEDSSHFEQPHATIWTNLTNFISHTFDLPAMGQKLAAQIGGGGLFLNGDASTALWDGKQGKTVTLGALNAGVKLNISRRVEYNPEGINGNGVSSYFAVIDTLKIELSANSGGFSFIKDFIPVGFGAEIKGYSKEFQMVHYAESWQKGYLTPFKLFSVIVNYKNFVLEKLNPQEMIKIEDGYGFGLGAGMGVATGIPLIAPGVGAYMGWRKTSPEYYFRDSFGQLFVYYAKDQSIDVGFNAEIAKLNLLFINMPLIAYYSGETHFRHEGELFAFDIPTESRMHGSPVITRQHRIREREAFEQLMQYGDYDPRVLIHRIVDVVTRGKWQSKFNIFLGLFKTGQNQGVTKTVVHLKNNETRTFYRGFYQNEAQFGANLNIHQMLNGYMDMLFTLEKDVTILSSEIDEQDIKNSTVSATVIQYDRKIDREGLDTVIGRLNNKYSKNKKEIFFRNYVLPDASLVDEYRKVLSQMRIYVSGKSIVEDFTRLDKNQIEAKLIPFFDKDKLFYSPNLRSDKLLRMEQIKKSLRRAVDVIWSHHNKIIKNINNALFLSQEFVGLIKDLHPEINGSEIIKGIFGEKNIFVYGEIFGVYPSFNQMQTFESVIGRRFAGKSWGDFTPTPPIRKFMTEYDLIPMNLYALITIDEQMLFTKSPEVSPFNF